MLKKSLMVLAIMGVATVANASPVNLVQNGSFEADSQALGTWSIRQNLTGWTGGKPGIELRNNVAGSALDGKNFVELDTTKNSAMWQDINTVAGQAYIFSFAYSNRPGTVLNTNGLSWSFGTANGSAPNVTDFGIWHTFTTTVYGTGSPMTLKFVATGTSDSYGTSLDKVSLKAVPVPAAVWLFGSGMLGLLGLGKRKRNVVNA